MMKSLKREAAIGHAKEVLDLIGQQSEHQGAKWIKYFGNLARKKELEENIFKKEKLKGSRKTYRTYYQMLLLMLKDMVVNVDRPGLGYSVEAKKTEGGIEVVLHTRWGKTFKRGFKPCGEPEYDLTAVMTLINSTEDTMWALEEKKKTDSGIYLT